MMVLWKYERKHPGISTLVSICLDLVTLPSKKKATTFEPNYMSLSFPEVTSNKHIHYKRNVAIKKGLFNGT
jgi:hypothetical protein